MSKMQSSFEKLKQSPKVKKLLLVFVLFIVLFFLFNDLLMPWYVHQRGEIEVPTVIGKSFEEAKQILTQAGFDPRQGEIRTDRQYPVGTVINQNPPAGKVVHQNRRIYLTLSGGERHVEVPNLRGRTLRDAKFQLEREGLILGNIEYQGSDEFPENTIIDQGIVSKRSVKRGTKIPVVVSQGRLSEKAPVPEMVGKTLAEATKAITNAGFKLGNVTYQPIDDVLPNTVIDQFPRVGEMQVMGGTIDLFVAQQADKSKEIEEEN